MNWIAMTIVNAPPEKRGDRVMVVRHNFEASIKRLGLKGEEAEAWLLRTMSQLRDLVEGIEAAGADTEPRRDQTVGGPSQSA